MGRQLQEAYGQEKQVAMTLPLIEGLDGVRKMSKSLNNYIGIDEAPNEIFGKSMSIPDELMVKYFRLATDLPLEEVDILEKGLADGSIHPRDAKMNLGSKLVEMYHGQADQRSQKLLRDCIPKERPTRRYASRKVGKGCTNWYHRSSSRTRTPSI